MVLRNTTGVKLDQPDRLIAEIVESTMFSYQRHRDPLAAASGLLLRLWLLVEVFVVLDAVTFTDAVAGAAELLPPEVRAAIPDGVV